MRPDDMGTLFDECAERGSPTVVHLDRPFDIAPDLGTRYDVAALARLVASAAGWLTAAGAGRGDRVAIVKDNHWDCDLLACAAIRIGAVPALLSGQLPGEVLEVLLKRLEPSVLVTTAGRLSEDTGLTSAARATLCLDGRHPGALSMDDVRGHTPPAPRRRHTDEPLVINHSSGTTGVPKLVVHSTRTVIHRLARAESVRWPVIGTRRDDRVASASSFVHGRTFCWTASVMCLRPKEIVIVSEFDPRRVAPFLAAHPPTLLEALPSTFVRWRGLAAAPNNPFRDVRMFASTYDAVHPPTVRTFLAASGRRRPVWMQGWGQTETGPLTFRFFTRRSVARQGLRHPTTRDLGRPMPGAAALRVVDPVTFEPVPRGRAGLVLARTAARCLDYVGERERWQDKVIGRWWNTGDLGAITRGGTCRFLDREVDLVPGTSCVELEDVLEDRLVGVLECVVLGVVGRPPLPVVVTEDGSLDHSAWLAATRDLPTLDDPRTLAWEQVPRTATGKVRRAELLDQLAGDVDRPGSGRWT